MKQKTFYILTVKGTEIFNKKKYKIGIINNIVYIDDDEMFNSRLELIINRLKHNSKVHKRKYIMVPVSVYYPEGFGIGDKLKIGFINKENYK